MFDMVDMMGEMLGVPMGFTSMRGNYEERKVDAYETEELFISTCEVTDADVPYETAVRHHSYNDGKLVIVETYDTKELAQAGHDRWVEKMTGSELPESLTDVSQAELAVLRRDFDPMVYQREGEE